MISPDGSWLVYSSDQSGRGEIEVQSYPGPGPTVPVSIGGAGAADWSADGTEIFYRLGGAMMAVDVVADGDDMRVDQPSRLFEGDYLPAALGRPTEFDVAADGRFLMIKRGDPQDAAADNALPTQVVLVENWFDELERLVPVN